MLKVMIADDEPLICRLVEKLADWDALGMSVVGMAENGLEALELIEKETPDVLITDIRMPGCSGLELVKEAKERMPELEVVIISGYAHFKYAQSAMQYGVGNYLLKPINQQELMETLQKIRKKCEARLDTQKALERQQENQLHDLKRQRESLIGDLLGDELQEVTCEMLRERYQLRTEADTWQVFQVKIDCDPRQVSESAVQALQEKTEGILMHDLSGICDEVLLYCQPYTEYGILNYPGDKKAAVRKILRGCLNQLDANKELFGAVEFSISLGVGSAGPGGLKRSMETARYALMERLLEGSGRLLEQIPEGVGIRKQNLLEHYRKEMEHAVDTLSLEEIRAAADHLEAEALQTAHICGRELMELVLSAGRQFIARIVVASEETIQQDFVYRCGQCGTSKELFGELRTLQEGLLSQVEQMRRNESTRPIRIAKQYVQQHFREPITLETVCEATGFSISYFSVLFKKETGEGFAKYLTRVRMEEAKTLLRETNLPVMEICEKAGYSDRKHFTHTFHKATGLNPAEYRKLYG